ncbi:hypothetical protein BROUX41_001597 [Berkeleyomyces rouxiae]
MAISYLATVTVLPTIENGPEDAAQKRHHVLRRGRLAGFQNVYDSWGQGSSPLTIVKALTKVALKGEYKSPDTRPPTVPVVTPAFRAPRAAGGSTLRATWLGHACYFVEFPSGLRVLFDPVFEDRCSPLSFMGPKRYTPRPCTLADLPAVDAVVISHSHYDHLSHPSVLDVQKHHPNAHFFVGLGLAKWFRACGLRNVTEMDWWEDAKLRLQLQPAQPAVARHSADGVSAAGAESMQLLPLASAAPTSATDVAAGTPPETIDATISCTPCQHTSARTPFDRDTTLWCSWAVSSGGKSVWFGGDTGYRAVAYVPPSKNDYVTAPNLPRCPQFAQIGQLRGPFDLGLIPIGAYSPRSAFSPVHANPYDAVEIFKDTRCRRAMGIHWGTWALTNEEVMEPPQMLREALRNSGIPETGVFDTCNIGESREF